MNPQDPTQRMREIVNKLHDDILAVHGAEESKSILGVDCQPQIDQALAELSKITDELLANERLNVNIDKHVKYLALKIKLSQLEAELEPFRLFKQALQQPNQKKG